jgi:hypothetical protein
VACAACGGSDPSGAHDAGDTHDASDLGDASDTSSDAGECTACGACVESFRDLSTQHVAGEIDYPDPPPAGGAHNPCWLPFGVYDSEPPDERWVHNMEHGAVVFLYNCPDGCPDEVAELEIMAASRPFALVAPYAALPGRYAAVAWGFRLVSECFDRAALEGFYEAHVNHGPESSTSPPPGGC